MTENEVIYVQAGMGQSTWMRGDGQRRSLGNSSWAYYFLSVIRNSNMARVSGRGQSMGTGAGTHRTFLKEVEKGAFMYVWRVCRWTWSLLTVVTILVLRWHQHWMFSCVLESMLIDHRNHGRWIPWIRMEYEICWSSLSKQKIFLWEKKCYFLKDIKL